MPTVGESFFCTRCGRESVAKAKRVLDGWTVVRECLACAFCGAEIPETEEAVGKTGAMDKLAALASLLGETPVRPPTLGNETESRFCKDCRHFLRHPFLSRCLLHNQATEPMDDCTDFTPRPDDEKPGDDDAQ
jgi:hypothetical protein